jgi:hypothetical protein
MVVVRRGRGRNGFRPEVSGEDGEACEREKNWEECNASINLNAPDFDFFFFNVNYFFLIKN